MKEYVTSHCTYLLLCNNRYTYIERNSRDLHLRMDKYMKNSHKNR